MTERHTTVPPKDAIRAVSLFCGIGGSDLGLYAAADELGVPVEVVDAIDSWEPAVRVYNANQRHPVARVADLKLLNRADLPEHDLIIGGPPCQPFSVAGKREGHSDKRNCLPDFIRLAGDAPYIMENVVARLINAPWSEKLCAADFGDVTSRKRWFYSNYLLHVVPTPGPRRIRDIRDHDEDARVIAKRTGCKAGNGSGRPAKGSKALKLGLRGNSASASAFNDDEVLGSLLANAFHANEASKLVGCRNPSLLEMARAHSIPDSWDWAGATKTQRGQMIASSWPAMMAKAVCKAMLIALIAEREMRRPICLQTFEEDRRYV